jgi:hypothetical protein
MKKIIFIALSVLSLSGVSAQNMTASIGVAGNPSNIRIYMLPSATGTANFSTLQFNVALPSTITPIPTLSLVSHAFGGTVNWVIDPGYIEGGYIHYNIYNGQSGYSLPVTAATEFQAMEVSFSGGPGGGAPTYANTAHLVCLPDGGTLGAVGALFYCVGNYNSDGQNLFYARPNVTIANGDSYRFSAPGTQAPSGTFTSFARLTSLISLPVSFTSFFAYKSDNNGILNWTVENQNYNMSHFEIERSFDGRNFSKIGRKDVVITPGSPGSYNYNDAGVLDNYSGSVYYRIKQLDRNGEAAYSAIRIVKGDGKGFALSLYPNPVEKDAKLSFTMESAKPVTITLADVSGKKIVDYPVQAQKGLNLKTINVSALTAGTYMFIIRTEDDAQTLPFVKGN